MPTDIVLSDLDGKTELSDGDIIKLQVLDGYAQSGTIEIALTVASPEFWRKSVRFAPAVSGDPDSVIVEAGDGRPMYVGKFDPILLQTWNLHLWKAKAFGQATDMYKITDASTMEPGKRYLFEWLKE